MKNDIEILKNTEIELMQIVDRVCKENNLCYYLAFGTLLGCIRHKCFIPWDDDVDIFMPRNDYELFIKKFNSDCAYLVTNDINNKYTYPFAKVCDKRTILKEVDNPTSTLGVYIDVFPLDGLPSDDYVKNKHLKRIYRYKNMLIHKYSSMKRKRSFIKNIAMFFYKIIFAPISYSYLVNKISTLSKKYAYDESEDVSCAVWGYEFKTFKKSWFGSKREESFEGVNFKVPCEAELVLKSLYGNYMELPPIEKQVSNHNFTIEKI